MDRAMDREAGYVLAPCHVTDEPDYRNCLQVGRFGREPSTRETVLTEA